MNLKSWGIRRKIILSNLIIIPLFFIGILMFNYTHASLIAIRLQSLQQQATMVASMLTARPVGHYAPAQGKLQIGQNGLFLREPLIPNNLHVRLYDDKGRLIEDSYQHPPGIIETTPLAKLHAPKSFKTYWAYVKFYLIHFFYKLDDIHHIEYHEKNILEQQRFIEVPRALSGHTVSAIRIDPYHMTLNVAVPVKYLEKVLGVLHMSISGKEITHLMAQDRNRLIWFFIGVCLFSFSISLLLARHLLVPLLVLIRCVKHLRHTGFRPVESQMHVLHALTKRNDEIGTLAKQIADMIATIQKRIAESENFAADVSHELKNPLTSLKNALETLERITDTDKRKRLLDIIYHDFKRIDRLIGDISKISRIDGQMQREVMEKIHIQEYLTHLVQYYKEVGQTHDIELTLSGEIDKIYYCMGLPERLTQVFANIIDNALSITSKGGMIDIHVSKQDHFLHIIIKDTGTGIPEDMMGRIFERFYSHRPLEQHFGNHSGLGLSIVKQVIIGHQGTIIAKNHYDPQGQVAGAMFEIKLPMI